MEYIKDQEKNDDTENLRPVHSCASSDYWYDPCTQCSHLETIQGIIKSSEEFFYAYLKYLETVKCQENINMKLILVHILKGFYNMTDITDEEKKLYSDPINFERLITSPWIRIVKNLELEEKGKFEYE